MSFSLNDVTDLDAFEKLGKQLAVTPQDDLRREEIVAEVERGPEGLPVTRLGRGAVSGSKPDGVLERVVVVLERLLGVEGRVEVGELHLADVLGRVLGEPAEARQRVEGIALEQEVVLRAAPLAVRLADRLDLVQQPHLGHAVVGGRHPRVAAVLVGEEAKVLVRPRELEAPGGLDGHGRQSTNRAERLTCDGTVPSLCRIAHCGLARASAALRWPGGGG
jgi:hypothetical protein